MNLDLSPLWISLKISLTATLITFIGGVIIAYGIYNYQGKWRWLLEGFFLIPLVLPPTIVGFILLIFLGKHGIIGSTLSQWGITLVFSWYGGVITAVVMGFPIMFRSTLGAFEQIDSNLLDSARVEGAKEIAVFSYIVIPLAMRGILSGIVLTFARILGEFGATLMVAGNIPRQTQTIPMAIYFAVQAGEIQEAWFWAIAILILSLGMIYLLNLLFRISIIHDS